MWELIENGILIESGRIANLVVILIGKESEFQNKKIVKSNFDKRMKWVAGIEKSE